MFNINFSVHAYLSLILVSNHLNQKVALNDRFKSESETHSKISTTDYFAVFPCPEKSLFRHNSSSSKEGTFYNFVTTVHQSSGRNRPRITTLRSTSSGSSREIFVVFQKSTYLNIPLTKAQFHNIFGFEHQINCSHYNHNNLLNQGLKLKNSIIQNLYPSSQSTPLKIPEQLPNFIIFRNFNFQINLKKSQNTKKIKYNFEITPTTENYLIFKYGSMQKLLERLYNGDLNPNNKNNENFLNLTGNNEYKSFKSHRRSSSSRSSRSHSSGRSHGRVKSYSGTTHYGWRDSSYPSSGEGFPWGLTICLVILGGIFLAKYIYDCLKEREEAREEQREDSHSSNSSDNSDSSDEEEIETDYEEVKEQQVDKIIC